MLAIFIAVSVLAVLVLWFLTAACRLVRRVFVALSEGAFDLEQVDVEGESDDVLFAAEQNDAVSAFEFEWVGGFRLRGERVPVTFMAVWEHASGTILTRSKSAREVVTEVVTYLSESQQVSVATYTKAMPYFQPPGSMHEAFPGLDLEQALDRHSEALDFVEARLGLTPRRPDLAIDELIRSSLILGARESRSKPLWAPTLVARELLGAVFGHSRPISEKYANAEVQAMLATAPRLPAQS